MKKECCYSLITDDHTDYCLSRQAELAALQQRVERLTVANERVRTVNRELLERIERLTAVLAQRDAALRFYADRHNYEVGEKYQDEDGITVEVWSNVQCEGGRRARAALADAGTGVAGEGE